MLVGNNLVSAVPILHRRIVGGITLLTLLGTAFLVALSLPSGSSSLPYDSRIPAELTRSEPCPADSAAATLRVHDSAHCQVLLVELLDGPDTGQLVALTPIFTARLIDSPDSGAESGEVIQVRSQDRDGTTIYHYAERNRTSVIFVLIALAGAAVLLSGHWSGTRTVVTVGSAVAILVLYSIPAILNDNSPAGVSLVVLASVGCILGVGLALDRPTRTISQLTFLGSALPMAVTIGLGTLAVQYLRIEDPVSADFVALSPIQAGSNLASFALLGLAVASLLLIRASAQGHIEAAFALRASQPRATTNVIFFSALQQGRQAAMNNTGIFVLASLSGALPLLVLLNAQGVAPSQALNNGLLASVVVRICVGVIGLAIAGPVAAGLALVLTPAIPDVDRSGENHHPRPPRRREPTEPAMVIDLSTPSTSEQSLTNRLRVGVEDS